jgi:hypothetical protein
LVCFHWYIHAQPFNSLVLDFIIINEFYHRIRNALISLICDDLSCELSDSLTTFLVLALIFTTLAAASLNLSYYSLMISWCVPSKLRWFMWHSSFVRAPWVDIFFLLAELLGEKLSVVRGEFWCILLMRNLFLRERSCYSRSLSWIINSSFNDNVLNVFRSAISEAKSSSTLIITHPILSFHLNALVCWVIVFITSIFLSSIFFSILAMLKCLQLFPYPSSILLFLAYSLMDIILSNCVLYSA